MKANKQQALDNRNKAKNISESLTGAGDIATITKIAIETGISPQTLYEYDFLRHLVRNNSNPCENENFKRLSADYDLDIVIHNKRGRKAFVQLSDKDGTVRARAPFDTGGCTKQVILDKMPYASIHTSLNRALHNLAREFLK